MTQPKPSEPKTSTITVYVLMDTLSCKEFVLIPPVLTSIPTANHVALIPPLEKGNVSHAWTTEWSMEEFASARSASTKKLMELVLSVEKDAQSVVWWRMS